VAAEAVTNDSRISLHPAYIDCTQEPLAVQAYVRYLGGKVILGKDKGQASRTQDGLERLGSFFEDAAGVVCGCP